MTIILRDRLSAVTQIINIEVAIFTSFNFHGDFFEQNILPTLFGLDSNETQAMREQRVHRGLLHTRVGVFCDRSKIQPSRKAYRYSIYPIFVEGSIFHPKNVIIVGRDTQGRLWFYIATMSANLTLSGWGRNCEGFADTWIHSRQEQPALALGEFLGWLKSKAIKTGKTDALEKALALHAELRDRRIWEDPEGAPWKDKENLRLYFSPHHKSMWSFLREQYGSSITDVKAASPYWGESDQIAIELLNVCIHLVAAPMPPSMKAVNLGADTVNKLFPSNNIDIAQWSDDKGRFHHVKLYEIKFKNFTHKIIGIGSCNFTQPGQFWRHSDRSFGNVESMIFDVNKLDWPPTKSLDVGTLPPTSKDDEQPKLWPFNVCVQYDWKTKNFAWRLEGNIPDGSVSLNLCNGSKPIKLANHLRSGEKADKNMSRVFILRWKAEPPLEGCVTEVNLDHSTESYGNPIAAHDILDSWLAGAIVEPCPPSKDMDPPTDEEDPEASDIGEQEQENAQVFDSFKFYQALNIILAKIHALSSDRKQLVEWLIGRSDSILSMATAYRNGRAEKATEWIVLHECLSLMSRHKRNNPEVGAHVKELEVSYQKLTNIVIKEIKSDLESRGKNSKKARGLLEWYDNKFKSTSSENGA